MDWDLILLLCIACKGWKHGCDYVFESIKDFSWVGFCFFFLVGK